MTLLYTHPVCIQHDTGPGHPERPARLEAVLDALRAPEFAALNWREAPLADPAEIARVHDSGHVEAILGARFDGLVWIDADTAMSPASPEAAQRAAGAVTAAVRAVLGGEARTAFCAVRPPGHHAEPDRAMGFCLFNSVAVAAAEAETTFGLDRIAIVDFDVHHGNGTEAMAETRPGWLYASTHQMPLYPGTGAARHAGRYGNIVNAPLAPGQGSEAFRAAFEDRVLPALDSFGPQLLLISAGFDAHRRDPLAGLVLEAEDFAWATERLAEIAVRHGDGRIVSTLEGGYDLEALAESTAAHVGALLPSNLREAAAFTVPAHEHCPLARRRGGTR